MVQAEEPEQHQPEPGDRLSRMSQASVRITETLDLDTVLRGVVDGACSLTGARHGGITVLDDAGGLQAFITSGLTPEEHELFVNLPGGPEFFEYLSQAPGPLRLSDFSGYTRALGLPEIGPPLGPVGAFLGAPIRHLGRRVGNLYLSQKEGGQEFTPEDEGLLALFTSQAALAIANARRYREEQRARADLEALVNTAPVGVVVFDARTGAPLSFNREARRIVDGLRNPDQSPEDLLDVLTFRRADGREISLRDFPLARALSSGETVRAEEIVIAVPDGRRVNAIVNATPIPSEEGVIESVVITLQDVAPIKELGRQRAEFLGMVSQELLTPLTSIKGSAAAVLEDLTRLDLAKARQFFRIIEWQADRMRGLIWDLLEVARIEAGTLFLTPEPTDLTALVGQAKAAFQEGGAGNPVEVDLPTDLPRVAADRQRVVQVLEHLLVNAANYSPEGSAVTVSAWREGEHAAICVADRGRGIPAQPLPLLFRRLSRQEEGDGGRGFEGEALGLAVCRGIVEAHGGRIRAESDGPGLGSRFIFTLPPASEAAEPRRTSRAGRPSAGNRRPSRGQGRVLVVDDDPQVLWYIRNTLTEAGYTPIVTWDPEEVERLIVVERPPPGAAGPGPARGRRVRADAAHTERHRRAGGVAVRAGAGARRGPGLRAGGRGLHCQALLAHGTGGAGGGGAAAAGGAGAGGVAGILPPGGPGHRLRPAAGDGGGPGGGVDRNGVPFALRAFGERRPGAEPGAPDEPGLVGAGVRRFPDSAGLREAAAAEAGGDRRRTHLHLQRTQGGLPLGAGAGGGRWITV